MAKLDKNYEIKLKIKTQKKHIKQMIKLTNAVTDAAAALEYFTEKLKEFDMVRGLVTELEPLVIEAKEDKTKE